MLTKPQEDALSRIKALKELEELGEDIADPEDRVLSIYGTRYSYVFPDDITEK